MDYTQSLNNVIHAGTGNRMHLEAQATPSVVSDKDINSLIWSIMEVVNAGGLAGAQFDPAVPATYQKLLLALRAAGVFTTPATGDRSTKAATTQMFANEFLNSLADEGWQKLPSGLIAQWGGLAGTVTTTSGVVATSSLPIAFPTQVLRIFGCRLNEVNNAAAPYVAECFGCTTTVASVTAARSSGSAPGVWAYLALGK
jgi:hypothetical protein